MMLLLLLLLLSALLELHPLAQETPFALFKSAKVKRMMKTLKRMQPASGRQSLKRFCFSEDRLSWSYSWSLRSYTAKRVYYLLAGGWHLTSIAEDYGIRRYEIHFLIILFQRANCWKKLHYSNKLGMSTAHDTKTTCYF